jgi:hypothetical protein
MHGGIVALTRLGLMAALFASVGCVSGTDDEDTAQREHASAPTSPTSGYDFSCVDMPHPARASDAISLSGYTNDSYTVALLPDVTVDLFTADTNALISTTWSDDEGRYGFALDTDNQPVLSYARMRRAGHVTSYLYPSRAYWRDETNVFLPVLSPLWREMLAAFAGVELDAAKGIVGVIVTDCSGERVEGATVTFDPPAETVAYWDPTFTDGSSTTTSLNGHAWGFNVPAGEVHATITIGDVTYRDWPVRSFAGGRTLSWRAP